MQILLYERYGDASVMHLSEVATPSPTDDEVLIQVHAASLNPFDWKLRSGALETFFQTGFPVTPGRDGAGVIVALGQSANAERVQPLHLGQHVSFISSHLGQGAMASTVRVKAKDFVVPSPTNMDLSEHAALPLVGLSAWNAMETAEVKSGMKVLIHGGSGGVGSVAIQIANYLGAEVHATCSTAQMERVKRLGAVPSAYDQVDFTDVIADCDVVFDTIGGAVHEKSYQVLKPGGCLVYLNAAPFDDVSAAFDVHTRPATVLGQTANLAKVMALASEGNLRSPNVTSFAFVDFADAFTHAETSRPEGKTVLMLAHQAANTIHTPTLTKEQP